MDFFYLLTIPPLNDSLVRPTPKRVPPLIIDHHATLKKLVDNKIENHELTNLLFILYNLYHTSFQREVKEEFSIGGYFCLLIGDYFCSLIKNLERLNNDDVDGVVNPNSMDRRIQALDLNVLMSSNPIERKIKIIETILK